MGESTENERKRKPGMVIPHEKLMVWCLYITGQEVKRYSGGL